MANNRLIVQAGGTAGVIYGAYDIFGSNFLSETITVHDGTEAYFQGDFQRGGDNIFITGRAEDFTAKIAGSNILLVSAADNITAVIPVGTFGAAVVFQGLDGEPSDVRSLVYKNGNVYLGLQPITMAQSQVDAVPVPVVIESKFDPVIASSAEYGIRSVIDVRLVDQVGSYVVWTEVIDGSTSNLVLKAGIYDEEGNLRSQFDLQRVGSALFVDVDISDNGEISIAHFRNGGDVLFSKFDKNGNPIFMDIEIGSFVEPFYNRTTINSDFNSEGDSIVVWKTKVGDYDQIVGALVDGDDGSSKSISVTDQAVQANYTNSRVSSLDGGGFVVVWTDYSASRNVFGQILNDAGEPVGGKFNVASGWNGIYASGVTDLEGYGFVVGYRTVIPIGGREENVLAFKIFDDMGNAVSEEVVVAYENYLSPLRIASLSDGKFAVSWSEREGPLDSMAPIYTQVYDVKSYRISDKVMVIESSIVHRDADSYFGSSGDSLVFGWSDLGEGSNYQIKFQELFITQAGDLSLLSAMSFA